MLTALVTIIHVFVSLALILVAIAGLVLKIRDLNRRRAA